MSHSWKNGSQSEKWVAVGKMGQSCKDGPQLETRVHSWKDVSVEKNESKFEKCVTVGKMGHSWKNWTQLEKCVTVEKISHSWKNGSQ